MNKYNFVSFFLFVFLSMQIVAQPLSPDEFLPHKLGEHFTPHHYLVSYFEHVAETSPLIKLEKYGKTNLDRPLMAAFISSEKNLANLENIRKNNLQIAGIEDHGIVSDEHIAIVWLSFSVHGNEASGSESSYQVLYDLVDPSNQETKKWLENTVVILDPSINPDGYSRYTHWVRNFSGYKPNSDVSDIEHAEPWPGGRTNYYLFDLNRDWAWQTQLESRQRVKLYNSWLPHVHADLHEMGANSPYYFAPAAQPYHTLITDWQVEFQHKVGKNHSRYFDKNGWSYFTKEVFDLFYPSYGDTYPLYNGAIGMTYEQGGGGRGGRSVKLENGEFLTLKDRIDHHKTTALSTVEVSALHADKLVEQFSEYFEKSRNTPGGMYKTYVMKKGEFGEKLSSLISLLDKHGILYGSVNSMYKARGYNYRSGIVENVEIKEGDLVISTYQPKSVMTRVLFDPESQLVDSMTYDITAWTLPLAYGLNAFALEMRIDPNTEFSQIESGSTPQKNAVAYILKWGSLKRARALSKILQKGLAVRVATKDFENGGKLFKKGSVVISVADNKSKTKNLLDSLNAAIQGENLVLESLQTGFSESGPDLGSGSFRLIASPKVLTVMGDNVRSYNYGQVRYYFEQDLDMSISAINSSSLGRANLDDYNTIILPGGRFQFSDSELNNIKAWVRKGGKLMIMDAALNSFQDKPGFSLKKFATKTEKSESEKEDEKKALEDRLDDYENSRRRAISKAIPGAVIQVDFDESNPLGYGIESPYFSLKTGSSYYPLMKDAWNVGHIPKDPVSYGFIGAEVRKNLENSMVFGVQQMGRGSIVYMVDNLLYRGFWEQGKFLFSNALFFAGK